MENCVLCTLRHDRIIMRNDTIICFWIPPLETDPTDFVRLDPKYDNNRIQKHGLWDLKLNNILPF